jgi:hypothetical protein
MLLLPEWPVVHPRPADPGEEVQLGGVEVRPQGVLLVLQPCKFSKFLLLSFKGTVSRDVEGLNILISNFCVCAMVFKVLQKLFTAQYIY